MLREFLLEDIVAKEGRPKDVSLANARRLFALSYPRLLRTEHLWHFPRMPYGSVGPDDHHWYTGVMKLCFESKEAERLHRRIAIALDPAFNAFGPNQYDYILFVPVDMRESVEAQLERHSRIVSDLRNWLYLLSTDKAAGRPRSQNLWRDTYIYLLAHHLGWRPHRIASDVFPDRPNRITLVKQALHRIDTALTRE